jgi:hypothetical protein
MSDEAPNEPRQITFIGGPYNGWKEKYDHDNYHIIGFCDDGGITHVYAKHSANTYAFQKTTVCKQK